MKQFIALFLVILGFTFTHSLPSFAAEAVNPGEDPAENMGRSATTEADVAAVGTCKECLARLKHGRLGDNTTYRPSSGSSATDATPAEAQKGTQ